MRTTTSALRAAALAAAVALAGAAAPAAADEASTAGQEKIFETRVQTGYRATDTEDDRSLLLPFDPLGSGPIFGFDLLYLTPESGMIEVEGGFIDKDGWHAAAEYANGAAADVRVSTSRFSHARRHAGAVETVNAPAAPYDPIEVEGHDANPGADYRDVRQDSRASVRLHAPSYPAHLRASGRIMKHEGEQQLRTFFRTCSTHICHVNDRTRPLDQETKEYALGADAHLGWVDVAYTHTALTYRDLAPDPVDPIGDINGGLPAGDYEHDVNPDLRSRGDEVRLNTLLSNRAVLSAFWAQAVQDNETSDIGRRTRNAGANLSWRATGALSLIARYDWDEDTTESLSPAARALREKTNAAHVSSDWTHQHVVEPEDKRHSAELLARYAPGHDWEAGARVGWRNRSEHAVIRKVGDAWVDEPEETTATFVALDGRVRPAGSLALDASAGLEKTDDPVLAIDTTTVARYGLGATWTPLEALTLRAAWQGYRGKNDDAEAIQAAYHGEAAGAEGVERSVSGDALTLMAAWVPSQRVTLSASYGITDAGIEQDMLFGAPRNAGYAFESPDTSWSGRTQIGNVSASWTATRRLAFTAEGLWIDGRESYDPSFEQGAGLEEAGEVDFTKLMATLEARVRIAGAAGVSLGGFWARHDDHTGDEDGTVRGLVASVDLRW